MSCQNCNLSILRKFWRQNFFEYSDNVANFFGLWAKYKKPLVKKSSLGLSQPPSARPDGFYEANHFFFHRNFIFPFIFEVWAISLSFSNKFCRVCQKNFLRAEEKKFKEIIFWKKVFSISFSDFEQTKLQTFTGKFWPELRKTFYVSRGLLIEQLFRKRLFKILGSEEYKWKFTDSGENFFPGLPKLQ